MAVFYIDHTVNHRLGDDFRPRLTLFAGDVGVVLRIVVRDVDGFPVDLPGVDALSLELTRPDGTVLFRKAEYLGDGVVAYTFVTGELDHVGHWDFVLKTGEAVYEVQRFNVRNPLGR